MGTESRYDWFRGRFLELVRGCESVIRGKPEPVALAATCMVAGGHLLIEDTPGTGKTTLAKTLAGLISARWNRIQFTPDLLPADVTGTTFFVPGQQEPSFREGPIFAHIVVADEINRAAAKTQSALLQVMEEGAVTVDGTTHQVPTPFMVVATQHPAAFEGTYQLPEAQLDRFLMRITLGPAEFQAEMEVVDREASTDAARKVQPVLTTTMISTMREIARGVEMVPDVQGYLLRLARATRESADLTLGVSTRGVMGLAAACRTAAAADGRHFVQPDDVKALAKSVWAHRLVLSPDARFRGLRAEDIIDDLLRSERVRAAVA